MDAAKNGKWIKKRNRTKGLCGETNRGSASLVELPILNIRGENKTERMDESKNDGWIKENWYRTEGLCEEMNRGNASFVEFPLVLE